MVVLNNVIPIDFNNMKKKLYNKLDDKIINMLNGIFYKKDNIKYIEYIRKNIIKELKEIMNSNNFLELSMNYNYCDHIYKRGSREGYMCCAKIFINPNEKSQKYRCSRHCRSYESKHRNYIIHKRCSHIKNNDERCKHICKNNNKYCYIHEKYYKENKNVKKKNIERLKNKRKLYLKIKKEKYTKHLNISKNAKNSEIKNILFKHIIYNYVYMKKPENYKKNYKKKIYDIT